ncbi:putative FBD domain, leucine-rich repeat domain superfamily, F-box-like domain superfamily [Helianthus annuus]|nr:putative FBD domain, leucine-rich repeat domain superfamily, F-box-like domain superfamily [Helianthus annuus]KAJ0701454.1 putative FBD domain, leucine-rich repeat domain superfamily, F-box-like domain superfamily [Helianthus annuus]
MKAKRLSKAQRLSSTTINTLPQTIIENILCLLPIQEAARTSILSKEWRYKWTTIPKLKFGSSTLSKGKNKEKLPSDIASARKNMDERCKLFNAIHHVLLMRQGPIHEFTFHTIGTYHCFELDQIIFHLSRNHAVKKLKLAFNRLTFSYKLPLCAFSMHQLTDLDLRNVDIDHQPIFSGFGSLRSLCLYYVKISTKALLHLLSSCPSLKRFTLVSSHLNFILMGFLNVSEYCKLLQLGFIGCKDCTIVELFECLPVIEHLTIYGGTPQPWLVPDSVPNELPTSLIHLKYFCFNRLYFGDDHGLIFLLILIKCSPNLEKIELEIAKGIGDDNETWFGILEENSDVRLEHLKELEIHYFRNLNHEMELVTVILARSPKLKKVIIHSLVEKDEESDMLKILLQAPRASPVEIVVRSMID